MFVRAATEDGGNRRISGRGSTLFDAHVYVYACMPEAKESRGGFVLVVVIGIVGDGAERVVVSYLCYYTYRGNRTTLLLLLPPLPCPHYSADKGLRL